MLCDSNSRHINSKLFFGKTNTAIRSVISVVMLNDTLSHWQNNPKVKKVIIHSGINDVKAKSDPDKIITDFNTAIRTIKHKMPNAQVAISSLIINPVANKEIKSMVSFVNSKLINMCKNENIIFITHSNLCKNQNLFDDIFHIGENGTKMFVKDITKSFKHQTPMYQIKGVQSGYHKQQYGYGQYQNYAGYDKYQNHAKSSSYQNYQPYQNQNRSQFGHQNVVDHSSNHSSNGYQTAIRSQNEQYEDNNKANKFQLLVQLLKDM